MRRILLIFDSCRYDTYQAADTRLFDELFQCKGMRASSRVMGTAPAFYLWMNWNGISTPLPEQQNAFPPRPLATRAEYNFSKELMHRGVKIRFYTGLPTLNQKDVMVSAISRYFEAFNYYPALDVSPQILTDASAYFDDEDTYIVLWLGETHAPYNFGTSKTTRWSEIRPYEKLGQGVKPADFEYLRKRQIAACEYLVRLVHPYIKDYTGEIIFAADHGECFGEGGRFGHGVNEHHANVTVPLMWKGF